MNVKFKMLRSNRESAAKPGQNAKFLILFLIFNFTFLIPKLAQAVVCCVNPTGGCTNITDDSQFLQNACTSQEVNGQIFASSCSQVPACSAAPAQTADPTGEHTAAGRGLGGAAGMIEVFGRKAFGVAAPDVPVEVVAGKIIQGAMALIGVIFGILIIYGGYLWMIARGNEEYVKKAMDILKTAVIGFIIVVAAYAITNYVVEKVITAAFTP